MSDEKQPSSIKKFLRSFFQAPMEDKEELFELLLEARENELLDNDAFEMVEGVLSVAEMQARDIMVPRAQLVVIEKTDALNEFLPQLISSGHSRFPVVSEDKDTIVGILLAKDILKHLFARHDEYFDINEYMRPPVFVPESKRLNVLLKEFRMNRNHMAVVVDEYGGVSGIITIEDILEEIVGDIADEHDTTVENNDIRRQDAHHYIVDALTPVETFNEYFESDLPEEDFDTVGGLVMQSFGHMPDIGEITSMEHFIFEVLEADDRRVLKLRVKKGHIPKVNE
ncbi:MAG: HlyC/CorC family transporter [Gammaproteobacteria bacterium]